MDRFNYVKNTFERYKLSLIFQILKNWQMCKTRQLIIKENFNTKNDMMECNILCNRRQLTIPKNITNYKQLIFDVFISNLHINKLNEQQIIN